MKKNGINYAVIYSYNDYEAPNALISLLENGKEQFHIEYSKLDKNKPSEILNNEVLSKKEEFLSYDIILIQNDNGDFIVKRINQCM